MTAAGWDTDKSGNITLCPVVGWTPAVGFGMSCLLRLETVQSVEHLVAVANTQAKLDALQIVLTPEQADQLAQDLLRLSAAARQIPEDPGN
ncbi:hypothetical protein ACFP4H_19950 [Pseudophaeobacter arcticus]|uniref:hypothetical protein n=1 Tax=Pseudophaeobacter arcticus TaxID=385492 RepID=UPI0012B59FFB|nr:hypothetical protein [Pseudophaeobacter arcticus]